MKLFKNIIYWHKITHYCAIKPCKTQNKSINCILNTWPSESQCKKDKFIDKSLSTQNIITCNSSVMAMEAGSCGSKLPLGGEVHSTSTFNGGSGMDASLKLPRAEYDSSNG